MVDALQALNSGRTWHLFWEPCYGLCSDDHRHHRLRGAGCCRRAAALAATMSYIPTGCDQQGRYPEAAEAATELGADDFTDAARFVIWQIVFAVIVVGAIAAAAALL